MANAYYPPFDVALITSAGDRAVLPDEDVIFYNITQDVLIDTLTTNNEGIIAAGFFDTGTDPAAIGDVVELRHSTYAGTARFVLQSAAALATEAVENHVSTYIVEDNYTTQTPDSAAIYAEDLNEPGAAPMFIGTAAASGVTMIPFQTSIEKNLRFFVKPQQKDFDAHAAALEQLDSFDLVLKPNTVQALFDRYTNATTTGTAPETIYSATIPANTLLLNGDKLEILVAGTFANGNTKEITARFGDDIISVSTNATGNWSIDLDIIRSASDSIRATAVMRSGAAVLATVVAEAGSLDFTADIDFEIVVDDTAAGDTTLTLGYGIFIPAVTFPYDSDVDAFLRATNIGNATIGAALDTLATTLKSAGIWTKLDAIYPCVGGTAETHKFNLKNPADTDAAFRITWVGGVTHDANGITGNGSTGYGNTHYDPSVEIPANEGSLGVYVQSNASALAALEIGANDSTNVFQLATHFTGGSAFFGANGAQTGATAGAAGLHSVSRVDASNQLYKIAGGTANNYSSAYTAPAYDVYILATNLTGSPSNYSSRTISFAYMGHSLTSGELTDLYTAVQAFQTALGRNV